MGTPDLQHLYDYAEGGNFLELPDSDGNEYEVAFDAEEQRGAISCAPKCVP